MSEKKVMSTYDELMQDEDFKKGFEESYKEFAISELLLALMEGDHTSVRKLAKEAGISTSIIQNIRTGKKDNLTIKTFYNIIEALNCEILIKRRADNLIFPLFAK